MSIFMKIAKNSLMANRGRTAITIVGVILTAAMITGVLTFAAGFQTYMSKLEAMYVGDWHATVFNPSHSKIVAMKANKKVGKIGISQEITYLKIDAEEGKYKKYIEVLDFDKNMKEMANYEIMVGRMAESPDEIVVPESIISEGEYSIKVGDTLNLPAGVRVSRGVVGKEGALLHYNDPMEVGEEFQVNEIKTYKVVGISKRTGVETYATAAYIGTSVAPEGEELPKDVFFKVNQIKKVYQVMSSTFEDREITYNEDLLMFSGVYTYGMYDKMVTVVCGILIIFVGIGSVALLYNAFSISANSRAVELGRLSAAGATPKQIRWTSHYESIFISTIGIPLGILLGIGIVWVIFNIMEDFFKGFAGNVESAPDPVLVISIPLLILTVIIAEIIIGISSVIAARKVSSISLTELLRIREPMEVLFKRLPINKMISERTGFEGQYAYNGYRNSKVKYRPVILSLSLSIALFVTASFISIYFQYAEGITKDEIVYRDIEYTVRSVLQGSEESEKVKSNFNKLGGAHGVDQRQYVEIIDSQIPVIFLTDEDYERYTNSIGTNPIETPVLKFLATSEGHKYKGDPYIPFDDGPITIEMSTSVSEAIHELRNNPGVDHIVEEGEKISFTVYGQATKAVDLVGMAVDGTIITSVSKGKEILGDKYNRAITTRAGYYKCKNSDKTYTSMEKICLQEEIPAIDIVNVSGARSNMKNLMLIANILAYGFVVLISLIAIVNIINTVSANLHMRKRELALLKSIGMSPKSLKKIIEIEGFLHGAKALAIGFIVSAAATIAIYKVIANPLGLEGLQYVFPWKAMIICVICVLASIYITMNYTMSKLNRDNITDILKNEIG